MKKVIAMTLCIAMMCGLVSAFSPLSAVTSPETPAGTPVSTVEEFIAMDPSGVYYLANDIDFGGQTFNKYVYTSQFKGLLDGNGHSLLGIKVSASSSDASIFAVSFGGTLKNLTIGTADEPATISSTGAGVSVAAIAGTMTDGATFDNVTIYADIKGDGKTAGFTSYMPNGKLTITNCTVYGNISGNPAAGFVTMSNGGSCDIEIRNSANYATVTAANLSAGGFYTISADVNGSRKTNLTIVGCANFGSITATDWRVGGIVGEFNEEKTSTLTIDYCYNMGDITMRGGGGYAGGIVGGLGFDPPSGARKVTNVFNVGSVRNNENTQRAYALISADKASDVLTITNAAYIEGCATNPTVICNNVKATNISSATDAESLLTIVSAYEKSGELGFVADQGNVNNGYPILTNQVSVHENVTTHACGRKVCEDCGAILSKANDEKHTYKETPTAPNDYRDGYITAECTACGATEIRAGEGSTYQVKPVDGVYPIDSADDLIWYATNLEAGLLRGTESLALTADIDMSGKSFSPIGTKSAPFRGKLDGDLHSIDNLTVNSVGVGGLFGYVSVGTVISDLTLKNATVTAKGDAGALIGTVLSSAIVKVNSVACADVTVTSSEGSAGALIGSTTFASDVAVTSAVATAKVSGKIAAGLVGSGDNTTMSYCFVNATLTSSSNTSGTLAHHGGRFSQKLCGYVRNQLCTVSDGSVVKANDFANGKMAYTANTYGANFVFGMEDGKVVTTESPVRMVRFGSKQIYTNKILSPKSGVAVYAAEANGAVTLAIVVDPTSGVKLVDTEIKVNDSGKSETVKFSDLDLNRYLAVGENYYTTVNGMILYTVTLDGVSSSATYSIGTAFNGTAEAIQ